MNFFSRLFVTASCLVWLASAPVFAAGSTAKGYEIRGARDSVLFTFDETVAADGLSTYAVFRSPEGAELVTEKMEYDGTSAPLRYTLNHAQSGESGVIEVKDGRLTFVHRLANGQVKTADEKIPELWAVGPMFVPLVRKHWEKLLKGEALKFRFAVWDRAETVGFELFKERVEKKPDGREVVVLKMKPSSFLIAAIVDPLFFEMRPDGQFLEAMTGRTLPKRRDGAKLKDLDAYIAYLPK